LAVALPWICAVTILTVPIGHTFRTIFAFPAGFAPACLWGVTVATGGVASHFAHGNVAVAASKTTVTLALERPVLASAVSTILPSLALGAVGAEPARVTRAHPWHDTFSVHAVFTNGFVAVHSLPTVFTFAFKWLVASSVDTTWKLDAFVAPRAGPSNITLTNVWFGTVAVDACLPIGSFTDSHLAHRLRDRPAWETLDGSVLVTVVVRIVFDVFRCASKMKPLVNGSVGPRVSHLTSPNK